MQRIVICTLILGTVIQRFIYAQTGNLKGTVLNRNTKMPLEYVNVVIQGTLLGSTTDSKGRYIIRSVPFGIHTIKYSLVGYIEKVVPEFQVQASENTVNIVLEETVLITQEVIITPKMEQYDASGVTARLNRQMVVSTPGSAQDIFWVIQTLPGIASDGDNSKLYVRGGSPDENLILYDGATIRNSFHFDMMGGGYWSIFNSRLIEKVEFFGGGFPARYGDRLSSVLVVENRAGNAEQIKGEASISMSDASGTLEAPLPFANGAAVISVRRSYFDAFIKFTDLAADYSVLPYFFDINSKFDISLSSKHRLTFSGLYSRERLYGYFDRPNYQGNLSWENKSGVVSARLRSIFTDLFLSDFIISLSAGNNSTTQPRNAVESYKAQELTIKQDFTFILPSHEFHFGGWLDREQDDVTIDLPPEIALNFNSLKQRGRGSSWKSSLFVDDKWTFSSSISASLGVRYEYVDVSKESVVSPRLNVAYAWNEHMSLSADYGWYYQSPRAYELAINNEVKSKRAESYGIGIKHEVSEEIIISLELYNKQLSNLVTIDSSWNLSNKGYGYARGIEFYIQLKNTDGFFGWLSYTYSISKRKEGTNDDLHFFDYDRPHLISVVTNYKIDDYWQAGMRFRYGSGRPYTPVASALFNSQERRWFPVPEVHNSDRYPDYNRMDVRLTRKFSFASFDLDVYLEILNIYNQKNIVHYIWNEDYSSKERLTIIPLLSIVGASAQF